jgi:hypothetical protein
VVRKKDVCAYKEQYLGANQQNIANYFSLSWGKTISRRCDADIVSKKKSFHSPL